MTMSNPFEAADDEPEDMEQMERISTAKRRNARRAREEKWGMSMRLGFVMVPYLLLRINQFVQPRLRLSSSEIFLLLVIASYWIRAETSPFPSIEKLSRDTCISERQVKRIIKSLKSKGYIKINKAQAKRGFYKNVYDLGETKLRLDGVIVSNFGNFHTLSQYADRDDVRAFTSPDIFDPSDPQLDLR